MASRGHSISCTAWWCGVNKGIGAIWEKKYLNKLRRSKLQAFHNTAMKRKGLWLLVGFLLVIFGFSAIILQLVGVNWAFLGFLEWGGLLLAFVLKVIMILAGVVVVVMANTDWEMEMRESS